MKNESTIDQFATHLPFVAAAVMRAAIARPFPEQMFVIECGSGEYSTPLLHAMVTGIGGRVLTLDNNAEWLERFEGLCGNGHEMRLIDDWASVPELDQPCDIALVDHEPQSERLATIRRLAPVAGVVICHDAQLHTAVGFDSAVKDFSSVAYCRRWETWTAIGSNKIGVQGIGPLLQEPWEGLEITP